MFQDANVKLIRELREEIDRLKTMLMSFELVCSNISLQEFCVTLGNLLSSHLLIFPNCCLGNHYKVNHFSAISPLSVTVLMNLNYK